MTPKNKWKVLGVLLVALTMVAVAQVRTTSGSYLFDRAIKFASSATASPDVGFSRTSAGVVSVVNGGSSVTGTLAVGADKLTIGGVIAEPRVVAVFQGQSTEAATDRVFFLADRAYQVTGCTEIHAVAAGGASVIQVVKDTTTAAPGAGVDLLTNNTNTGFDLNATANTLQTGTLTATGASLQLAAGDRLSVDFANTIQSTAGLTIACTLKAI